MVYTREITVQERASIVTLRNEGYSHAEIGRKLQISKSTVTYTLKRHQETGQNESRKREGRPRITTTKEDRYIKIISKRNRRKTAPEIRAEVCQIFHKDLSVTTVKRRLINSGLNGRIAKRKPLIRKINAVKRLEWAQEHATWSMQQWKNVLWSDESKFEIFGSHRKVYVRRGPHEKMLPECLTPTVKHGGGSVMVWGSFGNNMVGDFLQVVGKMNQHHYLSILENHAVPSGTGLIGQGFVFQHDNDPKHTAKLCRYYLDEQFRCGNLCIMKWPPQSPDLNPIEKLWDYLDVEVRKTCPQSSTDLFQKLQYAWNNISAETLNKLLERMPRLCKAVISAKGGHIDEKEI